ncbi:hypothetical protein EB008_01660 [bacterium]|nr:hypothetical protein [bacterium]
MHLFKKIIFTFLFFIFHFSLNGAYPFLFLQRPYPKERDKTFKEEQKKVVLEIVTLIKGQANYKEVYEHARNWRRQLAIQQKVSKKGFFGISREMTDYPLVSSLNVLGGGNFLDKLDLLLEKGEYVKGIPELGLAGGLAKKYQISAPLNGETIPLTQILRIEEPLDHLGINYSIYFGQERERRYIWIHTSSLQLLTIFSNLEKLFRDILEEHDEEKALQLIARFHWWFCQATPCSRGSASIGEVLAQSFMVFKNLKFSRKENSHIDLHILSEDNVEVFVKIYKEFYGFEA